MDWHFGTRRALTLGAAIVAQTLIASSSPAQGCEPIRFTTPVNLGGQGEAYQRGGEWQLTVAYRRLVSTEFFVGTQENSAQGPGGESPIFRIHTFVADAAYAFRDRYRLRLSVPVSTGSETRYWPDGVKRTQTATGIGDVSVMGEAWVLEPRTHQTGNVSLGLGLKAPTGRHTIAGHFYTATSATAYPTAQQIQPGDGGWAVLLQGQAFHQLASRVNAYAFGSYMVSPKARSDVRRVPVTGPFWSVPDVYSARLGAAFLVLPEYGLTMSLGGRIDGIPVHDLVGGGDEDTVKPSAVVAFADPGLSFTRGRGTWTASVPYRFYVDRLKSIQEQRTGMLNGGGFAKYLVFVSYTHRL
jgi:hypothetical protein